MELILPELYETDFNTQRWDCTVKTGESSSKSILMRKDEMIRWQYNCDFEAHFGIHYDGLIALLRQEFSKDNEQEYVYPYMLVSSLKIPETDWVTVNRDCTVMLV